MHINAMTQQPNGENGSNSNLYMRLQQSQTIRANIQNISQMLNTGLSPEALDLCVKLLETGVHPQALAEVVTQIRREMAALETDNQ
ncbi:mitotic-spindle organizing protein 1 [Aedes aegypti]|uniref:Mitotic-spindle organizing gamma-tubulin ring associated n=1 Tax=Aedes aegypti TaxID=7159 RepID=A0A1S4FSD5_AEDAE|nr:mitotic-spindle organizing protein 1 [Aedes aegypti]